MSTRIAVYLYVVALEDPIKGDSCARSCPYLKRFDRGFSCIVFGPLERHPTRTTQAKRHPQCRAAEKDVIQ